MKYWSQKGEDDYKMLRIYNSETNALVEMKDISEAMRFWFETYPQWESDRTSTAPKTTTTTTTTTTKTATTTTATTSTTTTTTATTTVETFFCDFFSTIRLRKYFFRFDSKIKVPPS